MTSNLSDISYFVNEKINIEELNDSTYISTENMLPDKGGVTKSSGLPNANYTQCFSEEDILLSNIRPYFKKIWYATFNGGCSNDVLVLRAKCNVCSKFLYYVLSDDKFFEYDTATSKGTKMPRGDKVAIMKYSVPQYNLSTQEKIARVLSSLDDKIELNNKINQNLEQQAQAIFKSWFVDFEPFGGNMPEAWKEKTLDEFCNIFTGKKNANQFDENGEYLFFTCAPTPLRINSFIYDGAAIIIAGNGAYTGRTTFYKGKFDLYQRTYACTIKTDIEANYIYLLYIIIKNVLQKKIMGGTHGSAIPYIVMNDIAKFKLHYEKTTFDKLSQIIKSFIKIIQRNNEENERLAQLRDTLLPKLMSGEIDVDKVINYNIKE